MGTFAMHLPTDVSIARNGVYKMIHQNEFGMLYNSFAVLIEKNEDMIFDEVAEYYDGFAVDDEFWLDEAPDEFWSFKCENVFTMGDYIYSEDALQQALSGITEDSRQDYYIVILHCWNFVPTHTHPKWKQVT